MEDIRPYRDQEEPRRNNNDDREYGASPNDEEVPFEIPRD